MKVAVLYTNNKRETVTFEDKDDAGPWFEANQHRILEYVIVEGDTTQKSIREDSDGTAGTHSES